jgi:hypothetical protein
MTIKIMSRTKRTSHSGTTFGSALAAMFSSSCCELPEKLFYDRYLAFVNVLLIYFDSGYIFDYRKEET